MHQHYMYIGVALRGGGGLDNSMELLTNINGSIALLF